MSELLRAIESEHEAITAALAVPLDGAAERLAAAERVWLVGTGSSQHAAELGALMFSDAAARDVRWRSSAGFDWEGGVPLGPADGVVVISHTGETALARRARARALAAGAQVVSITAQGVDWPEAIQPVARERSETYTGSYLAALVVLARLSLALGQSTLDERELARLPEAVGGAMPGAPDVTALDLTGVRAVVCAGVGPAAITAREAALKLREAARVLAEGYEAEYLLHGCAVPLDRRDALLAVQPSLDPHGLLAGLLDAAQAEGLLVGTLSAPEGFGPVLAQIPLTVQAQLLAARTAEARGQNPDTVITGAWGQPGLWAAGAPDS